MDNTVLKKTKSVDGPWPKECPAVLNQGLGFDLVELFAKQHPGPGGLH